MNSKWKGTSVTFDKANNILVDILKKKVSFYVRMTMDLHSKINLIILYMKMNL